MRAEIQYAVQNPFYIFFFINNKKGRVTLNFAKMQHNDQTNLNHFIRFLSFFQQCHQCSIRSIL